MISTYPHEDFLKENNLKAETLPNQLQKRILGFEKLKEDLPFAFGEDYERLAKKLHHLSLELEEDIREEFEDHLKNYDKHS